MSPDRPHAPLPWVGAALLCAAVAISATFLCFFPVQGQGVWMQMAMARAALEPGEVSLSHTVDDAGWTSSTWLSDLALYGVHHLGGAEGLIALRILLILFTLGGAVALTRGRPGAMWGVAALAPFALSFAPLFRIDSHLFSWALAVWQFTLVDHALRRGKRWPLLCLPALYVLWSNVDQLALLGWLLLLTHALGMGLQALLGRSEGWFDEIDLAGVDSRRVRELLLWVLAAGAAILVNPHTVGAYGETFRWLFSAVGEGRQSTIELLASSDRFGRLITFFIVVMVAGVLALGRMNFGALTLMLLLIALALWRFALAVPFALLSVALVGPALGEALGRRMRRATPKQAHTLGGLLTALTIALIAVVTVVCFPRQTNYRFEGGVIAESHPSAALDLLRTGRPAGEGFHSLRWGGPLVWELGDQGVRAYVDPRITLYGPDFFTERYLPIATASVQEPSWLSLLRDANVTWVLLSPREAHTRLLREALLRRQEASTPGDRDWGLIWFDDVAEVYARRDAHVDEDWDRLAITFRPDIEWLRNQSDVVLRRHPEWRERLLQLIGQSDDSTRAMRLLVGLDERVGTNAQLVESLRLLVREQLARSEQATVLYSLGTALLRAGEAEEAIGPLSESVALDRENVTAWEQLAAAHWMAMNEEETLNAYRTVLRLAPNNPTAREALQAHEDGTLWDEHPANQG